ncbi:MAG: virulence RhuM family protein [Victivallales bacterium]|nr:virulence RhuM family protein [Victivallales bacterium]
MAETSVSKRETDGEKVKVGQGGNSIVIYQPNETIRLEVRLADETVWLNQSKLGELFGVDRTVINRHINNIYKTGELEESATCAIIAQVQIEGKRTITRRIPFYNLDVIIAVGYRVNSFTATQFRRWANSVLKDYLLRGYAFNQRLNQLEDKMDRCLAKHDDEISALKDKVDFFVQASLPPMQGIFYDGQVFDAKVFAAKHILSAKKSILLIDSWVDVVTLELLAKKDVNVTVDIVTSHKGNNISQSDIASFNKQYGGLTVRESKNFHDRFLVIDDAYLYLIGASLKDLGWKCFAFTKLDSSEIPGLKART